TVHSGRPPGQRPHERGVGAETADHSSDGHERDGGEQRARTRGAEAAHDDDCERETGDAVDRRTSQSDHAVAGAAPHLRTGRRCHRPHTRRAARTAMGVRAWRWTPPGSRLVVSRLTGPSTAASPRAIANMTTAML